MQVRPTEDTITLVLSLFFLCICWILDCWHFFLSVKHNPLAILNITWVFAAYNLHLEANVISKLGLLLLKDSVNFCMVCVRLIKSLYLIQFPGKRKIHYLFADGKEMAEEYDLKTDELVGKLQMFWSGQDGFLLELYLICFSVRRWRHKNALGAVGPWQVEVGEPITGPDASTSSEVIKENCSNVSFFLCSLKHLNYCIYFIYILMITINLSCFCLLSPYLCAKTQRQVFSGESATSPFLKMSLMSLWSHLRDVSSLKPQTKSKDV